MVYKEEEDVTVHIVSHLAIVQGLTWLGGGPLLLPDVEHTRGVHLDGGPGGQPPRLPEQRRELGVELGQLPGGAGQLSVVHHQHHDGQSPESRCQLSLLSRMLQRTDDWEETERRAIIICVVTCSDANSVTSLDPRPGNNTQAEIVVRFTSLAGHLVSCPLSRVTWQQAEAMWQTSVTSSSHIPRRIPARLQIK